MNGNKWLKLTSAERDRYTEAFVNAYGQGWFAACDEADKATLLKYDGQLTLDEKQHVVRGRVPWLHCIASMPKYSKMGVTELGTIDVGPYPALVTQMYQKHPDSRLALYDEVLPLLRDGGAKDVEDLYRMQQEQLPHRQY